MKYLITIGNPKQDDLCHTIIEEAQRGGSGWVAVDILNVRNFLAEGLTKAANMVYWV